MLSDLGSPSTQQANAAAVLAPITAYMPCPASKVSLVIGKKGSTIQAIMKQSGCKISIDQDRSDGSPRQIGLTGEPTGLAAAMTLIAQVMENNYSGLILNNDLTASSSSPTKLSPTAPVAPSLPEPALDVTQTTSLAPVPVSEKRSFSSSNQPSSPDSTPKTSSNLNKKLDSDNTNMQMNMRSIATALKGEFADSNLLSSSEKRGCMQKLVTFLFQYFNVICCSASHAIPPRANRRCRGDVPAEQSRHSHRLQRE